MVEIPVIPVHAGIHTPGLCWRAFW
jgi:hypothetical protein